MHEDDQELDLNSAALIPIEQKQVDFYGDVITAALVEVETNHTEVYVPLKPISDYLGLAWNAQLERIKRNPVMSEALKGIRVTRTNPASNPEGMRVTRIPSESKSISNKRSAGGAQSAACLPLEMLPGWLFGIDASRVRPELKDKIVRYQKECFKVLWQAFQADALSVDLGQEWDVDKDDLFGGKRTEPVQPAPANVVLVQIREMGLAIAQLAEQQLALEQQVDEAGRLAANAHVRLDNAAHMFKEFRERLGEVERKVTPAALINEEQAAQIGLTVKALAEQLTQKDGTKNHYQAVYQELYRRFGVSSYKRVRAGQFEAVMTFLENWRGSNKLAAG